MTERRPGSWLRRLVRALGRLGGRRIPALQQMEIGDCGPTCLAMVLRYHGKNVRQSEVREATGTTSLDGATAFDLKEAARRYGLRCRAVWLKNVEDLRYIDTASILHVLHLADPQRKHFVVLKRATKKRVDILDPDGGVRRIPIDEFGRHFAGTVLEFEPADDFQPTDAAAPAAGARPGVLPDLWRRLWRSRVVTRIVLTSLLVQVFALALPLLTSALIDHVVPRGDRDLLKILAVGLAGIVLFNFLTAMIRAHLLLHLRTRLDRQMTRRFVEHLLRLSYGYFQSRSTGDLAMRLNSNATIREMVTSGALAAFLDGTTLITYSAVLLVISPLMFAIVIGLALPHLVLLVWSRRRYQALMTRELQKQADARGYEVEMLVGIETLKATGAEPRAWERWSHLFDDVLNVTLARGRLSAFVESGLGALRLLSPLLILCAGALLVLAESGPYHMTLGTLFAVNALAAGLLSPLASVVSTALQFSTVRSYIERIDDVLEAPVEQAGRTVSRAHPLRGGLTLEGVSFRYGPPHRPLVVRDVSVDIHPGQHVAIVGRSGCGKSTLARLLVALYSPTAGRILYDGADVAHLDYASLRRQLGFVPQDPFLFGDTIRRNIALANPEISRDEVIAAARLAHVDQEIESLPEKYDTVLADRGLSLSGGQRQRIALARALVHKPTILVLDEATSDLDAVTERGIQAELESLRCTTIIIAHRLSTIVDSDLILMMQDGQVVERGTHEELMSTNGAYARFVAAQLRRGPDSTGHSS